MVRFLERFLRSLCIAACLGLLLSPAWAADGDLDTGFGTGGKLSIAAAGVSLNPVAMARQADGKLLVAGNIGVDSFVYRLNADGSLDGSWGGTGMVTIDFGGGSNDFIAGVASLADGRVLVGGSLIRSGPVRYEAFIARFNADGSPDTSFGSGGKAVSNFGASPTLATRLLVRADGRPLVVGYRDAAVRVPFVFQTLADGSADPAFGGGIAIAVGTEPLVVNAAVLQGDGKLVLSAYNGAAAGSDFRIVRIDADGALDRTFGNDGVASIDFGAYDAPTALFVSANGRLFAAGISVAAGGSAGPLALVCLRPADGAPCSDFGNAGKVLLADPNLSNVVMVQSSGTLGTGEPAKLLLAGTVPSSDGGDFFQFRLDGLTGARDAGFGSNGYIQTDLSGSADVAVAAVKGSLITSGRCRDPASGLDRVCLVRFVDSDGVVVPRVGFEKAAAVISREFIDRPEDCLRSAGCTKNQAFVVVALSEATSRDVKVRVKSTDGTAKAGFDYIAVDTLVTIPAGSTTATLTLEVPRYDIESPATGSPDLGLQLDLSAPENAVLGTPSKLDVTVVDARSVANDTGHRGNFGCTLGRPEGVDPTLGLLVAAAWILLIRRRRERAHSATGGRQGR